MQSHSKCTRMQSLTGANNIYQVVEEGHEVVIEAGVNVGAEPSDTRSGFVL
jgi:hypothetical protein